MVTYLNGSGVIGKTVEKLQAEHRAFASFFDFHPARQIVGTQVLGVTRKAKYILFKLDNGYLVGHNKFTGFWSYSEEPWTFDYLEFDRAVSDKDIRFRIGLEQSGKEQGWLNYHDARCLGMLRFEETRNPGTIPYLAHLGPDIITTSRTDPAFMAEWPLEKFIADMTNTAQAVKLALLNQKLQAGIGNIYACEALWRARINPFTPAKTLATSQLERLKEAVNQVITDALTYKVKYDRYIKVFREKTCPACQSPIVREVQANRGTYMCPACQS